MSYTAHTFSSKIHKTFLEEMDAQIKANADTLSELEVTPSGIFETVRTANILKYEKTEDGKRVLTSGAVQTYAGNYLFYFDIDEDYEEGTYYFNLGDNFQALYSVNANICFYSSDSAFNSSTLLTGVAVQSISGGGTRNDGMTINIPSGCKKVLVSTGSGSTMYTTYVVDGVPLVMLSKRFIPYMPYEVQRIKEEYKDFDKMKNSRIYWLGDSIMHGLYCSSAISKKMDTIYGTISINKAVSGSQIYGGGIVSQIANLPEVAPDVVVFDGGCNDSGVVYGTESGHANWELHPGSLDTALATAPSMTATYSTDTCVSSFEDFCQKIRTKYPNSKIVYVVTHYCGISARLYADQKGVLDAYKELAKKWGCSVVDMREHWTNAIIDNSFTTNGTVADGTHPSDDAHYKYYIPAIASKIREILPD